jgi:hypothetical protein
VAERKRGPAEQAEKFSLRLALKELLGFLKTAQRLVRLAYRHLVGPGEHGEDDD